MTGGCIMSSGEPPSASVGAELRLDSDDTTTGTGTGCIADKIAYQRAMRAANIKRRVSSKSSASRPLINGAIISLVIYSLFQILSTINIQLLNVLTTNTWLQVYENSRTSTPDHLLITTDIFNNNERSYQSASHCRHVRHRQTHYSGRLNSFHETDVTSPLAEPTQHQRHHKNAILTKFDSHNIAVTTSYTQQTRRQETTAPQQNNDEVDRSSSSEPAMIYEASRMLEQLVQIISKNLLKIFTDVFGQLKFMQQRRFASPFGSSVLFAQAAQLTAKQNGAVRINKESNIIVLNVTNFNEELIQDKHPFPHIKVIEYSLPSCVKCRQFKSTFVNLSKEVYLWRNVIRPSAIDLSVKTNEPIADSWSIEYIPTLRVHPPPNEAVSNKLQSKYDLWSKEQKQEIHALQRRMFREYTNSVSLVKTFEATKYIKDTVQSGSQLLRSDLLDYIYSFVEQAPPTLVPKTWPNLKPVTETKLEDLMRRHLRKELFLIIEQKSPASLNSSSRISSGFKSVMDMSSTSAYKATRYMYASENPQLLRDIISTYSNSHKSSPETTAAIETLNSLLKPEALSDAEQQSTTTEISNNNSDNKLVLIHIDLTHQNNNTLTSIHPIPFVHIVTPADLVKFEAQHNEQQQQMSSSAALLSPLHNSRLLRRLDSINRLTRRQITTGTGQLTNEAATSTNDAQSKQAEQQQRDQQFIQLSPQQRIKLISLYINEIYTPQPADKAFVDALAKLDENPTSNDNKQESLKLRRRAPSDDMLEGSSSNSAGSILGEQLKAVTRLFKSASSDSSSSGGGNVTGDSTNKTIANNNSISSRISANSGSCRNEGASDYNDKLKAIRYILFTEVPRRLIENPTDNREKIRTLLDLVTVIKHYFPLPDSASIQFIDGVHRYLSDYLYQSQTIAYQYAVQTHSATELNAQMFKQELKRLESEGKRLPEIQEWSYCGSSGYVCGLWRLFHTLTVFEYNKLSQIYSQQQTQQQQSVPSAQYLSKGSNQHAESEYLHLNTVNESRQSQQLHQFQKHQQLVKLTQASPIPGPASPALPAAPTATTNTTAKAAVADKSIHNRNSNNNNNNNSTTPPSTTAVINEVTMPSPVERVVSPPATSTSLSLTIATPTSSNGRRGGWGTSSEGTIASKATGGKAEDAELPTPVLLVMRDYVINYFSCEECAKNFRKETANLSLDRIVQYEKPEFSLLWLWEAHNRISKRLSVNNGTDPHSPREWYPSYKQCNQCYKRPPSYLNDPTADSAAIFRESVEWDKDEILRFLIAEYTKTPMDNGLDLFGYQVPYGFVWIVFIICVFIMIVIRCAASYIERQRRHKAATILNGNGVHYSTELQRVS